LPPSNYENFTPSPQTGFATSSAENNMTDDTLPEFRYEVHPSAPEDLHRLYLMGRKDGGDEKVITTINPVVEAAILQQLEVNHPSQELLEMDKILGKEGGQFTTLNPAVEAAILQQLEVNHPSQEPLEMDKILGKKGGQFTTLHPAVEAALQQQVEDSMDQAKHAAQAGWL
jgi:hypothetical protein